MSAATFDDVFSQAVTPSPQDGLARVGEVAPVVVALRVASLVLVALLGVAANVLVAVVFYRRPTLRSPSNRFVLSLVLANVLTSMVVTPVVLANQLPGLEWLHQAAAGLTTLAVTASVFSVLAIAVDRYHAVLSPLHYAMTVTRPRSRGMVVGAWGVAVLLALPVLLGATDSERGDVATHHTCSPAHMLGVGHSIVLATLGFALPLVALCWIYTRMYKAAHLNNERTRRHSVSTNPGEAVSRPGSLEMPLPPSKTPLNPPPPPRRRCSNASFSTLLFREEGKAVKTAIMVITSFLVCFTPYFVTHVWDALDHNAVPSPVHFLSLLLALGSGCLTPFIYVFRNEAVRAEALKIMLFWRPTLSQYGNNVSRDFESYNHSKTGNGSSTLGHSVSQRRQSLSYSDSVSVQSFQIPLRVVECRHCSLDPPPPSADFVATYEVMDSPGDQVADLPEARPKEEKPTKVRRESVTFRLAFMPQRRCQTCIRQNSDSSSGSGHPLLREGEGGTPPSQKTAHQRRKRFLASRQGSSGEEVSGGSEPNTPKHVAGEANNNMAGEAVILELDEPPRRNIPRSPPVLQLQETSLDSSDSSDLPLRQDSTLRQDSPLRQDSSSPLRQDSGYSDATNDSGAGSDITSGATPYQASITSLCVSNSVALQTRRHRPALQRLAAVEDEDNATETEEISPDAVRNKKNKSTFRTRFHRPAFRIPICEI